MVFKQKESWRMICLYRTVLLLAGLLTVVSCFGGGFRPSKKEYLTSDKVSTSLASLFIFLLLLCFFFASHDYNWLLILVPFAIILVYSCSFSLFFLLLLALCHFPSSSTSFFFFFLLLFSSFFFLLMTFFVFFAFV